MESEIIESSDFPVQSDVHWAVQRKPSQERYTSRFVFASPVPEGEAVGTPTTDDGDLDPPRKPRRATFGILSIRHAVDTFMPDVGLQVWPASLLMAEYFFSLPPSALPCAAVELGCGTGFAGLALALAGVPRVTLTDHCTAALENALANVQDNTDAVWPGTVVVRRLDLLHWAPANDGKSVCAGQAGQEDLFRLSTSELEAI
eukprot:EG_transcript_31092